MRVSQSLFFCCSLFYGSITSALSLQHVSHTPKYIDFIASSKVTVSYTLDEPAQVTLNIFDDRDILINKIKSPAHNEKGMYSLIWHGRDFTGSNVPAEAYKYTLVATGAGETVEHDVSELTGGKQSSVYKLHWDKEKKLISYRVLKPLRVNIRVGLQNNGPLMATLSDWLPRESGLHEIPWDGYDSSGVFNLADIDKVQLYSEAFTLSENTILVGPKVNEIEFVNTNKNDIIKRQRKVKRKPSMKNHSQQYIENRGDFKLRVVLPSDLPKSEAGVPIVKDIVPIRFTLTANDNKRILNDRYEPILFIDGKYFVENEVGFFPMTWNLDSTALTEGEHYLTINLRGYDGHFGTATAKIFVQH